MQTCMILIKQKLRRPAPAYTARRCRKEEQQYPGTCKCKQLLHISEKGVYAVPATTKLGLYITSSRSLRLKLLADDVSGVPDWHPGSNAKLAGRSQNAPEGLRTWQQFVMGAARALLDGYHPARLRATAAPLLARVATAQDLATCLAAAGNSLRACHLLKRLQDHQLLDWSHSNTNIQGDSFDIIEEDI